MTAPNTQNSLGAELWCINSSILMHFHQFGWISPTIIFGDYYCYALSWLQWPIVFGLVSVVNFKKYSKIHFIKNDPFYKPVAIQPFATQIVKFAVSTVSYCLYFSLDKIYSSVLLMDISWVQRISWFRKSTDNGTPWESWGSGEVRTLHNFRWGELAARSQGLAAPLSGTVTTPSLIVSTTIQIVQGHLLEFIVMVQLIVKLWNLDHPMKTCISL